MVVGAEHVDAQVESALPLVQVVGEVTGDVGRVAVALDDDAVLVVAVFRCAQPGCAVLLVNGAVVAQFGDRLLDPAAGVHRVFVGVDVEVGAELVQGLFDVGEHQVHADGAEGLALVLGREAERVRRFGQHVGGDVVDVGTGVAVLRGGLSVGGGDQGVGEPVDLSAVVVEVVLAHHLAALGGQQTAQRVADGGPPGAADVDRSGGVGRDELEVNVAPGEQLGVAVGRSGVQHVGHDLTLGRGLDPQVHEAGSGHLGGGDTVGLGQRLGQPAGQLARVDTGLLRDLQRDIGGVVAVLGVTRPLDGHLWRQGRRIQAMPGQHCGGGAAQQFGEIGGGHDRPSYCLTCSDPASASFTG